MRLRVAHTTTYRYDQPMKSVIQSHRLFPSLFEGQSVIAWDVAVEDATAGAQFTDGAGDQVQTLMVRGPVSEVAVVVTGEVETTDLAGMLRGHKERVPPLTYMRSTPMTRSDLALERLSDQVLAAAEGEPPLELGHRLCNAVRDAIAYRPGVTEAHTTAAEALAIGEGVCQDHAHVLITLAHAAGIPARYVSGYLFATDDGTPHEAAHAWAELWFDDLGWVGFDPSNGLCPNENYIRLGSGFDALDAAPIRGVARGPGTEALDVSVAVEAAQQ